MTRVIRVVVVDDSAYVRKVIKQMLSRSPFIEVVGTCRDGEEALETVSELQPDVVTLDLIMPGMGGLGFLQKQMAKQPLPVIVVSISNESSQQVLEALDLGAIDFVQKPSALATEKVLEMSEELVSKVKAAAAIPMKRVEPAPRKVVQISGATRHRTAKAGCDRCWSLYWRAASIEASLSVTTSGLPGPHRRCSAHAGRIHGNVRGEPWETDTVEDRARQRERPTEAGTPLHRTGRTSPDAPTQQ